LSRRCGRAKAKIGLQNLAYNIRRLVTLERMAATSAPSPGTTSTAARLSRLFNSAIFSRTSPTSRQRNSAVSSSGVPREMPFEGRRGPSMSHSAPLFGGAVTSAPVIGITEPVSFGEG
jgi:hypothetical protein